MTRAEFWEIFHSEDAVPADPDLLLDYAIQFYQAYLESDENSFLRTTPGMDWEAFVAMIEQLRQAEEAVRVQEQACREAEARLNAVLKSMLCDN